MARNNNNFLHKKTLITANSVTVETLDDSAEAYLRAVDSAQVKTVDGFPGANIADNTISPDAIANQSEIVSGGGGLTSGGVLGSAITNRQTYMNWEADDAGPIDYSYFETYSTPGAIPGNADDTHDYLDDAGTMKFYAKGQFWNPILDSGLAVVSPFNNERGVDDPVNGAYTFFTRASSIPLLAKGNVRFNLNTVDEDTKNLIKFFGIAAGADSDEIHSIQILDSANAGDPGAQLYRDDYGNEYYMTLLDSLSYNDISPFHGNSVTYTGMRYHPARNPVAKVAGIIEPPPYLIHTTDALVESDGEGQTIGDRTPTEPFTNFPNSVSWGQLSGEFKFAKGLKGIKLANNTGEFSTDPNDPTLQVRNKASRIRFKTRKSAGLGNVGASPSTYGQNASQMPIGETVSNEVWSNVSNKFVYKVSSRKPMGGNFYGYATSSPTDLNKINFANNSVRRAEVYKTTLFTTRAGAASEQNGYLLGGGPGNVPTPAVLTTPALKSSSLKFPFSSEYSYYLTNDLMHSTRIPLPVPQSLINSEWADRAQGFSSYTNAHTLHNGFITKFPFATDNNVSDFTSIPSALGVWTQYSLGSNGDDTGGFIWYRDTPGTPHNNSVMPVIKFPYASGTSSVFSTQPGDQIISPMANVQSDTHAYGFVNIPTSNGRSQKFSFADGTRTILSPGNQNLPSFYPQMSGVSSTTEGYIYGGFLSRPSPQGGPLTTNIIRRFSFATELHAGNTPRSLLSPEANGTQHISV